MSGYNDVITFPKGAASIKVQQRSVRTQIHDGNYLALAKPNGQYILNGGLTLTTMKKDIEYSGKKSFFFQIKNSSPDQICFFRNNSSIFWCSSQLRKDRIYQTLVRATHSKNSEPWHLRRQYFASAH